MTKRVAVMDLGTNTFHLLIAEGTVNNYHEIVHYHEAVKLGEGGINKGYILPDAFERGLNTMQQFQQQIDANQVQQVRAIATSALRNASNGKDFINEVKARTGIGIEIIDGEQEADFIYNGVKISGCLSAKNSLIMDIGGGSVEFILGNAGNIIWKQSFEIGAARLMDLFHRTDPIPPASIEALDVFLDDKLAALFTAVKGHEVDTLIGSSGAFETFAELIETEKGHSFNLKTTKNYSFDHEELLVQTSKLIQSTHQQRVGNKSIIPVRVDMIVVASLITRYIMHKLAISKVLMCTNSLKEGVLAGMLD
ncbi:Ppx/GppA phosphatase family protein [Mucilaginibacter pocheonensis]|uniref:Exopolyphosphatase/guanosine-5'-triphosphate, 3'-diphosphate pyrophosphatase n=1 Tax=Mucilaginibacter pocheonensis TaxID=398050 RepID=A0ABU1TCE5_9SPHI|nr:exopolyphosphatase [Mucilaginibacter pocheonensis]MDR6943068.1 exopolyphosphatase/guanosine-5'-triphosphate,3'-diphosphate pyrophosphatase [Mucilaginibacter pocheonensis]